MGNFIDLTGEIFGRWKVLRRSNKKSKRNGDGVLWICECSCDAHTIKEVRGKELRKHVSTSCGCFSIEKLKERSTTHGKTHTRIYQIWLGMKKRCLNPKTKHYKNYGGRGIKICNEWLDKSTGFMTFYNWSMQNNYKDHLSIDRINNDGNYEPGNCKWSTNIEQAKNKRTSHYLTFKGQTKIIMDWSHYIGINEAIIRGRIKKGLPLEKILERNPNKYFIDINL